MESMQANKDNQAGQKTTLKPNMKISKAYASLQGEKTILKEQEDSLNDIFVSTQKLLREMREWREQHKTSESSLSPQEKTLDRGDLHQMLIRPVAMPQGQVLQESQTGQQHGMDVPGSKVQDPVSDLIESYVATIGRRESAINQNLRTLREMEVQVASQMKKLESQNHDHEMSLVIAKTNLQTKEQLLSLKEEIFQQKSQQAQLDMQARLKELEERERVVAVRERQVVEQQIRLDKRFTQLKQARNEMTKKAQELLEREMAVEELRAQKALGQILQHQRAVQRESSSQK